MSHVERSEKRRDRPRSRVPKSGDGAPAGDTEDSGRAAYATDGSASVWGDPDAEPNTIPAFRFTAFPPERELYADAFRAAYKYPDALMQVMNGVRKGLDRGKKAAERAGGGLDE